MSQKLTDMWDWLKAFFKYSGTIVIARATMLSGFVIAAVGTMDWSPLYNLIGTDSGFTAHQATWLGLSTFGKGLLDEFVRRRGSTFPVA